MTKWYYSKNSQRQGPLSSEQLKQLAATGQLQPSDLVWKEGMAQWSPASSIKGLFAAPAVPPPPSLPPAIENCPATQATTGWNPPFKLPLGFHSWPVVAVLLLCCFPFGLYLIWTHPSWTRNVKVVWSAAWLVLALMVSASRNSNEHSRGTSSSPTANNKREAATAMSVYAWTLVAEYKDNEVAADEKYKGKTLKVNGYIGDIKKDITDTMYVILQSGGDYELRNVQCFFSNSEKQRLVGLSKGQMITVRGRCDGLMMNVLLRDCAIVK